MAAKTVGAFEAKTHLSKLLEQVREEGAVFRITHRGKPIAELRPIPVKENRPVPGLFRGQIAMRDDFDEPLEDFAEYE